MTESSSAGAPEAGRPIVFRGGTVLPMDSARSVLRDHDVLVVGQRVEAVGPGCRCRRARARSTPPAAS